MKSRLVFSGTSLSSFIAAASNVQFAGASAVDPQRYQHAGEIDGGEHGSDDADQKHDGEAANGARSEIGHDRGRNDVRHVGVENRAESFVIAGFDGVYQPPPASYF